jgi:hypothetical protein
MVAPLLVTPSTWHDETRFTDLALTDGICTQCFATIGWSHAPMRCDDGRGWTDNAVKVWYEYWVTDEDMETAFCPQCYEELTKETE